MPTSVTGRFLSLNVLKQEYERPGDKPWAERAPILAKVFKDSQANVFALQECGRAEAEKLSELTGFPYRISHINVIMWDPKIWAPEIAWRWPLPAIQNRTLIVLKLLRRGTDGYVLAAGSHLAVATSNPKFKRKVSKAEALAARILQYRAIAKHTKDMRQIILGYDTNDSDGKRRILQLAGWVHALKDGTDEISTKRRVVVTKVKRVKTNGGSDHKNAIVVDFVATNAEPIA